MDYQNGKYGYPPSDEDPNSAGEDPNAPRPYPDDPAAYGATPLNYGQDAGAYGSAYGQDPNVYGSAGSYENDYSARQPGADYGSQDPSYSQQAGYGAGNEYARSIPVLRRAEDYSQPRERGYFPARRVLLHRIRKRIRHAPCFEACWLCAAGNTSALSCGKRRRLRLIRPRNTARTSMPRGDEEYGYSAVASPPARPCHGTTDIAARQYLPQRYPQEMREDDVDDFYDREAARPARHEKGR
jgi:hypothetical protein